MKTTPSSSSSPTVIIAPGNGCNQIRRSNWYGQLHDILTETHQISCICEDFPDALHAKREIWVPHIRSLAEKQVDSENVILVGHSSGAQAALRYAEEYHIKGIVLVSATYTDLGDAHERASGYYPQKRKDRRGDGGEETEEANPYLFGEMKKHCKNWHQFHSDDDPFIPLNEAERIRDGLGLITDTTYHMLPGRSHFFEYSPELLDAVLSLC